MKSYDWIVKIKETTDLNSDNKVAIAIGLTRAAISDHKHGRAKAFSDEHCLKIAEILGVSFSEVVADQRAEGAKNPELKSAWQQVAKTLSQSAALAVTGLALLPAMESASRYILC